MLRINKRAANGEDLLRGTVSTREHGAYRVHDEAINMHPGIAPNLAYRLKRNRTCKGPSPLSASSQPTVSTVAPRLTTKPPSVPAIDWITDVLFNKGGIVAAIPGTNAETGGIVALDQTLCSGNGLFWIANMSKMSSDFKSPTVTTSLHEVTTTMEAVTLQSGVPRFVPEGDVYGKGVAYMDAYVDAGLRVTVRPNPYMNSESQVCVDSREKQQVSCARELSYLLGAAERGLAPCVLAAFYSQKMDQDTDGSLPVMRPWESCSHPKQTVSSDMSIRTGIIDSLVTVSQVSTFTLGDMMQAVREAQLQTKRDHLSNVLRKASGMVFDQIRHMCTVSKGFGLVKMNLTPESIVFCPKLAASGSTWKLEGVGHMPVSSEHLDGVPMMTDFHAVLTSRVREAAYSFETSFIMHSLLLVAYTRAMHGPSISKIMWQHLLSEGDPTGFVSAARALKSRDVNASSFLATLAANPEMHHYPELYKAAAEVVSDMDGLVRTSIVSPDGRAISKAPDTVIFNRMVAMVTGSTSVDTAIFSLHVDEVADQEEMDHVRALEQVKAMRNARVVRVA